jgi:phenylalanyl-tRNA synthetase beta chain
MLGRLDLEVERSRPMRVTPPTFRRDLEREIDLIEEVARIYGYDRIDESLPPGGGFEAGLDRKQELLEAVAGAMTAQGFLEAITYSFMRPSDLDAMRVPPDGRLKDAVRLLNPLAETGELMRTTMFPGMMRVAASNLNRGNRNLELYEMGRIFFAKGDSQPDEVEVMGMLICGMDRLSSWAVPARKLDFFDLKGTLENAASALHLTLDFAAAELPWMAPGKCALVSLDEEEIGAIGQVHPDVATAFEIEEDVFFGEVRTAPLVDGAPEVLQYSQVGRFPGVKVDVALIVDESVEAGDVEREILALGGRLLSSVRLFDLYRGEQVGPGKKSLAFALEFESPKKTLTDEETHKIVDKVVTALSDKFSAVLRGGEET